MSETETGTLARQTDAVAAGVARARSELASSEDFARDAVRQDAALRSVAAACEAAIAIAGQIIERRRLGVPDGSRASFGLLQEAGLINEAMRVQLVSLAGFRNLATKQVNTIVNTNSGHIHPANTCNRAVCGDLRRL